MTESAAWVFRRLVPGDAGGLLRICGDPEVMRYWHPGPDRDLAAAEARIAAIESHWQAHGFGDYGVVPRDGGSLIGFAGLHHIPGMDEVNVGYALRRDLWGRGLGAEICRALLRWGFNGLGLPVVVAVIDPHNAASVALATSCGMTRWKRTIWSGQERIVYRIPAAEWVPSARRS